ncbi:hypothetical protein CEXT_766271 [Caerostris extrusa]|uniref:Secreted protein n=1 Tax=Caerostris extrusa TaxID=172846 RepID=A0AAV4UDA4_CAEEX|nr:hypothetical protein CEXT_766271 [Caerostris extrusa]
MFKNRAIYCALHVCTPLLDFSCNAVATFSTDVEATAFLPLPDFIAKEHVSSNLLIIFCRPLASIEPQTFSQAELHPSQRYLRQPAQMQFEENIPYIACVSFNLHFKLLTA